MIPFKKILVPVDFSGPSREALTYGLLLATQFNAKLIVAHIVPESSALTYAFPTETVAIEEAQCDQAKNEIQGLVSSDCAAKVGLQTIVRTGIIDEELIGIVRREAIDLVVMGTHGRRDPGRWLLGSVTERLLRKVPAPVMTVSHVDDEKHALEVRLGLISINRILLATDLSDPSSIAMKYAVELAQGTGADLTVVHVVEYLDLVYRTAAYTPDERAQRIEEIGKRLNESVAREKPETMRVQTLVVEGTPYEQILSIAEARGVDLIVLNLQGKGVLERAFLGSTAERVVRLARIPVFSVPVACPD